MKKTATPKPLKLTTLLKAKGALGLGEAEIKRSLRLTPEEAAEQGQALEAEGKAIILNFAPLFLVSRESLEFLQGKLTKFIEQHHRKHPDELGLKLDKLHKHFDVPKKVLTLALKYLEHEDKVRETGGIFSLAAFETFLSPPEEKLLVELEQMSLKGELSAGSLKDAERQYRLSPKKMEKLLAILVEKKRVVQSGDGFYVNSAWLDDVVGKIRAREVKELSVADFKQLTGLSRKYAIPILELLDEMGVTRRQGSTRQIL